MCRIKRVDTLDSQTLDIQFDSGHVLLLDLNALRGDPAIAQLLDSGDWCRPRTDGAAVCGRCGPCCNKRAPWITPRPAAWHVWL